MKMNDLLKELTRKIKTSKKGVAVIVAALFVLGFTLLFADRLPKNQPQENSADSFDNYAKTLEEKIKNIASGMGLECEVSVVLETGGRNIYLDTKKTASYSTEEGYVVIKNESGGETGLLVTTQNPTVAGVAAVLHGATSRQSEQFKESVAALLNIRCAKINVIVA